MLIIDFILFFIFDRPTAQKGSGKICYPGNQPSVAWWKEFNLGKTWTFSCNIWHNTPWIIVSPAGNILFTLNCVHYVMEAGLVWCPHNEIDETCVTLSRTCCINDQCRSIPINDRSNFRNWSKIQLNLLIDIAINTLNLIRHWSLLIAIDHWYSMSWLRDRITISQFFFNLNSSW